MAECHDSDARCLDIAAGSPGHCISRGLNRTVILGAGRAIAARRETLKEETMPDRILTSHTGSLPRPEDLIALNKQRAAGEFPDEEKYLRRPARLARLRRGVRRHPAWSGEPLHQRGGTPRTGGGPDRQVRGGGRPENVVASTDCGLGGRVHPQIAWAELGALTQGAELATKRLWG
jgi:hypothetical protein